jgi:hypothetical protein
MQNGERENPPQRQVTNNLVYAVEFSPYPHMVQGVEYWYVDNYTNK